MTWQVGTAVLLAYLLGAIPFGLLLGLWLKRVDIRQHGSRNIGATNTLRVLGKPMGITALILDISKGFAAVWLARLLGAEWGYAALSCGLAAVLGHVFPVYLGFKGGKGVATGAGIFLALATVPLLIAVAVFVVTVLLTRMVSAGSCIGAVALAAASFILPAGWALAPWHFLPGLWPLRIFALAVAALILVKHRGNIQRILRGEENKLF